MTDMSFDKILEYIGKSKISIIGFFCDSEDIKDELISKIDYKRVEDNNFNLKSLKRDNKVNSILYNQKLSNIYLIDELCYCNLLAYHRKYNINKELLDICDEDFKLLIIKNLYEDLSSNNFSEFSKNVLYCDFAIAIKNKKIIIIKNRF